MFTAKELNEMSKEAPKYKEAYEEIMEQIVPQAVERAGYGFFDAKCSLSKTKFKEYSPWTRRRLVKDILDELHSYGFDVNVELYSSSNSPQTQVYSYEELQNCEVPLDHTYGIQLIWKDK